MEAIVTLPCSVQVAHVAINHALVVTLPPWRGDRLLLSQCCTRAYSGSIILEPVLYWRYSNKLARMGQGQVSTARRPGQMKGSFKN